MKLLSAKIVSFFCMILIVSALYSCSIESYTTRKFSADSEIISYLNNNGYDVSPDSLGLVYIPLKQGNNIYPQYGDVVAFHYVGYYLNGEVFDSSYDKSRPLVIQLGDNQLIKGLEYSLLKMDKGAKSKVIIPFYLAYDNMENGPVPPYSNLVFELELIDIDKK
jgi:FKBP-type peptidyl-prolyl cis-trans isomerase